VVGLAQYQTALTQQIERILALGIVVNQHLTAVTASLMLVKLVMEMWELTTESCVEVALERL